MNDDMLPILYSFRRCPYAMRARMALWISATKLILREVKLGDKPLALREASAKATVPVLVLADGQVIDESFEIMLWALRRHDPENWLDGEQAEAIGLIQAADGGFKKALDRFKYPERFDIEEGYDAKTIGIQFLEVLEERLKDKAYLFGKSPGLADIAIFPFVRQFANVDKEFFAGLNLPALKNWLNSLTSSELFEAIMTKFEPWKPEQEVLYWGSKLD
jgi:glutathione S-transferase